MELLSEDNKKGINWLKNENKKLGRKFSAERKRIIAAERVFRNRLNRYYNYHLKKLDETGIYNSNIRIITYNSTGEVNSDTGTYFRESLTRFSPLFENKDYAKDKSDFFSKDNIFSSINVHEYNYTIDKNYYHARYIPVYRNPASSERLTAIITEMDANNRNWMDYLKENSRIAVEISDIANKIRARLDTLRENKKVPGKDKEFISLYSGYKKLLKERENAFIKSAPYSDEMAQVSEYYNSKIKSITAAMTDEIKKIKTLKADKDKADEYKEDIESSLSTIDDYKEEIKKLKIDIKDAREDIWQNRKLSARNAMRNIREAALYDYAILKQKPDPGYYRNYLRSSRNRNIEDARWDTLRKWVMSARSETSIPDYVYGMRNVKLADDGVLAYSRSEIEEYMWSIDSTPIAGTVDFLKARLENGIVESLLKHNITGFHSVLIDKTEGVENIESNRYRMIIYSIITAIIAIFMTYFLVGFMVKRVKGIIGAVQIAATGDLKVEFPEKGLDEIEDLSVSLNGMMRSLRDKEALEGEIAAAGEIQKTLLPEKKPSNLEGFYSIGTFYRSMQGVGGDYYDFIELDDESIFFCIADVSSHGAGPAIVMSMMRAHIHGILRQGVRDLASILLELNRQIFITFFAGIINKTSNEIEYCSPGHLKPVLYKYRKDSIEILEAGGLPVGMDDNDIFSETITVRSVQLKPGDLFFQYTDGVSEAMDEKRNLFTEERMYGEIKKYARKKPDILVMKIAEAVEGFTGKTIIHSSSSELNDDIAMIAFKRTK